MKQIEEIIDSVIAGDNVEVLKTFPDNCVDLIITSPPYDSLRYYDNNTGYINYEELVPQMYRILKPGGLVIWVVGDETINGSESGTSFKMALDFKSKKFLLHDTMIYEKNGSPFPAKRNGNRYTQIFEFMFVFSKNKPKTVNLICDKPNAWHGVERFGTTTCRNINGDLEVKERTPVRKFSPRYNIVKFKTGKNYSSKDEEAYLHPAIFPEQLAADNIQTWTLEGDVVLDLFNGSGTVCKMAKILNRKFIGIDISEKYCELARLRINRYHVPLSKSSDKYFEALKNDYLPFLTKKLQLNECELKINGENTAALDFYYKNDGFKFFETSCYYHENVAIEYQKETSDGYLINILNSIQAKFIILLICFENKDSFYLLTTDNFKKLIEDKTYKLDTGLSSTSRQRNIKNNKGDSYVFTLDCIKENFILIAERKRISEAIE